MSRFPHFMGALLALLWIAPVAAQQPTGSIRGRVTDNSTQQPLSGVTVVAGSRAALSQADGRYVLTGVPAGSATVRARMVGYAPATQDVSVAEGEAATLDLALTAQAINLAEIVVTGYGEQRAGNITGAVTQITEDQFNGGRIISPEQLIQSKIPGVQVVDNNEPGGGISIRVRGPTSVDASSEPLYVVDGVPMGIANGAGGGLSAGRNPLNFLNPNDIESITVLRDASAAAIYGANAANGVLIIQTKGGRQGPQFEYTGSTSASQVTRLPDMLNATQFATAVQTYATATQISQLDTANTDWFSLVDQTAFGQDNNFAVSGSGETMDWRLSGGYLKQNGVIRGTTTERLSVGLNFNQRLFDNRLDVRTSLRGSRADDQFTPGGVLSNAAQMGPTQPVFDSTAPTGYYDWPGNTLTSADNPLALLNLAKDHGRTYRSIGNMQASYRVPFVEGLKANLNLGFDVAQAQRQSFYPSTLHGQTKTGTDGSDYRSDFSQSNTTLETYLSYLAPLHRLPGTIDITGGYSWAQGHSEYPSYLAQGLTTDILGGNGITAARTVQNFQAIEENRLISFFGRVNYNLNDRYLASASIRRDGSSRFGPANQWGTFPSLSLGWRISEESFMKGIGGLSDLKLRAAWGKTGNQSFANYVQYAQYKLGDAQTQVQFGNQFVTTIRPGAYNAFIQWEGTRAFDLGLDYSILGQRVSGSVDWYTKSTDGLIFTVPVCAGCGLSNFNISNIGKMRNRGLELSLSAQLLRNSGRGLTWTADITAAHNKNEMTQIYASQGVTRIPTGLVAGGVGTFIQVLQPGVPVNSFYVYQQRYDSVGKPIQGGYVDQPTVRDTVACPAAPGCVGLYRPDGLINQDDRRPFHDPAPKWILGHTSYFTYGKLDLNFTLRAYLGNWVYNNVASNLGTYSEVTRASPYNLHASVLETGFTSPQYQSDLYVEDASFLRMDNVSVGLSFKYRGQPMRAFGTIQNAFTLTGYSGVDPTAGLNGLDNNIYPRSRTFTGGLSVRF
ncbi:MAG TPA: SusC/RagA family TonB-linked outer membrane protein [Gemmatimonadales bacterium]|jgi:iron complex outermembrane receptor protein|nr:SusC/RagA family TonB-linked outer membrane protein [Gemmatimonadales bacterium]